VLAFQVEVLANGVFKQSHVAQPTRGSRRGKAQAYSAATGSRGCFSARTVRFLPARLAW
jgi:hypothetical protein